MILFWAGWYCGCATMFFVGLCIAGFRSEHTRKLLSERSLLENALIVVAWPIPLVAYVQQLREGQHLEESGSTVSARLQNNVVRAAVHWRTVDLLSVDDGFGPYTDDDYHAALEALDEAVDELPEMEHVHALRGVKVER